jgi:putative DNA primase/helicase
MSTESRCIRAALAYAERFAFAVFPCSPGGKTPVTDHGFKDATKDPERIRRLWATRRNANVGIATGAVSGIIVLDVDPRHGGCEALALLEEEHGRLLEVPTVLTGGGGTQLYFRHPGISVRNSAGLIGPGLDVRADGGYVIGPPSTHPNGCRYYWEFSSRIDEIPIADAPGWLLNLFSSPPKVSQAASDSSSRLHSCHIDFARLAAGVSEGQRDIELFRLACSLRRRGYHRDLVEGIVLDAASRCHPPFPQGEALRKVASAWRYVV